MPAPIIGETSTFNIVRSLRELWLLTQNVPAGLAAAVANIATLQSDVAELQATRPAFSVHKGGTDQTGVADATFTAVTFGTEVYDRGDLFASNVWTPPAGLVTLKAGIIATGTLDAAANGALAIAKNGTVAWIVNTRQSAGAFGGSISVSDVCDGNDTYEVQVFVDLTAGTGTVSGTAANTWFMGEWLQA